MTAAKVAPAVEIPAARILAVTEAEYFADPCDVPSLSQSLAHTLVTLSPLHAWTKHPRLNPQPPVDEPNKARDEGSIIHSLLLGKGADLVIIKADNYRTKAAQELRDAVFAEGRVPVLEGRHLELMQVAANLRGTFIEYGIQLGPESEFAIEWLEPGFHGPVVCRGRPDNLHRGFTQDPAQYAHTAFDLKKIKSADPETCSRHIYEYGYDIQRAAYTSAISKLLGVEPELVDFVFVFMEIEPPYAVNPVRLDETLTVMGERRWQRAVGLWEHCSRENRWPSYTRGITTIEAPLYAIKKEESTYGSL